jgi:hypothetical protein
MEGNTAKEKQYLPKSRKRPDDKVNDNQYQLLILSDIDSVLIKT